MILKLLSYTITLDGHLGDNLLVDYLQALHFFATYKRFLLG